MLLLCGQEQDMYWSVNMSALENFCDTRRTLSVHIYVQAILLLLLLHNMLHSGLSLTTGINGSGETLQLRCMTNSK